jgi:hypothetical protein
VRLLPDPDAVNPVTAVPRCRVEKGRENALAMNVRQWLRRVVAEQQWEYE